MEKAQLLNFLELIQKGVFTISINLDPPLCLWYQHSEQIRVIRFRELIMRKKNRWKHD